MIHINANVDQRTGDLIDTGFLHGLLHELYPEAELRIVFVARDLDLESEVWQEDEDMFIRVVLPYEQIQQVESVAPFIIEHLITQLKKQQLFDSSELQLRLEELINLLNKGQEAFII